jgi:ABC-type sugar transport system substrate-binding protein
MRVLTALTVVGLACLSAAPASAGPQGKRIALLNTKPSQPYMAGWNAGFLGVVKPAGISVQHYTTVNDAALQSQQMDDAIAQKVDMIVLGNLDHHGIIPSLVRAKTAGIPVILVIDPLDREHDDLYVSYIGTDQVKLGRLSAESLVNGLAGEDKTRTQVVAVTGTPSQNNTQQRMQGFKEVLASHPDIALVAVEDGKWQTAPSEQVTSDLLVRFGGKIDGIFAMADIQATGAIQAVQAAGLKLGVANKGIIVVASNCMSEGIQHIHDGTQFATNTQIPTVEGKFAAEQVIAYFNGQKMDKIQLVLVEAVTSENVGKYADACSYDRKPRS